MKEHCLFTQVYLGYLPNLNVSTWSAIQLNERKRYTDLRRQYIEEPAELMTQKNDNLTDNNPLALNESVSVGVGYDTKVDENTLTRVFV